MSESSCILQPAVPEHPKPSSSATDTSIAEPLFNVVLESGCIPVRQHHTMQKKSIIQCKKKGDCWKLTSMKVKRL